MTVPIRWTVQDRYSNTVYLTQERWQHISEATNHPEMEDYEDKMTQPVMNYDETSDTLYISFVPDVKATGIELSDHILLRIDKESRWVIGITFLNYSILIQKADFGPRSFPLTGLTKLSDESREMVLEILAKSPVKEILSLSTYTPSFSEAIPITVLHLSAPQTA